MNFLIFVAVLVVSFLIGAFGFPQIVGTLKYFRSFRTVQALYTIILWLAILGFYFFAVIKWLFVYKIALYIGFAVSFLMSLNTKPD